MQLLPEALEKDLARPVARTSRGQAFASLLLSLQFQHSVANVWRREATLATNVLQNGLTGRRLRQTASRVGVVSAKAWLSTAVLATHTDKANVARLVAADAIGMLQTAGLHLSHGHKEAIRNQVAVLGLNKLGISEQGIVVQIEGFIRQ